MNDEKYMRRALALAKRALGRTSPNPMVGAVIVKGGRIVAEDYHRRAGMPHAEALAIAKAGQAARGATLYVSLEPCCHVEKRTPPCTRVIKDSGLKRVVVAMEDPNRKVSGRGIRELMATGIDVSVGLLEGQARALNEAYVKFITTGMPFVILKTAMTLDGKIATPTGQSKWITGQKSRRLVHRLRGSVDAVMTAVGTVMADDPELTSRLRGSKNPIRVVIDSSLRSPLGSRVFECPPETIVVTKADKQNINDISNTGITVIKYKKTLELKWLMKKLAKMGITSVLVEAGSSFNASVLSSGVVDKAIYFIAPKLMGGAKSYPAIGGEPFGSIEDVLKLRDMKVRRAGEDIVVEGYL